MGAFAPDILGLGAPTMIGKKGGDFLSQSLMKSMAKGAVGISKKWTKVFGKGMKKGVTALGGEVFLKLTEKLGTVASGALNILGVFLQLADALGILKPILDIVSGVFSMIGGAAMQVLAPAIQKLAAVLFSDEMIKNWTSLGTLIGGFVSTLLGFVISLFQDPQFMAVMKMFGRIIGNIFTVLTTILGWFFDILGKMSPQQIGLLFYALGIGLAFMVGLLSGGPIGPILGAVFAGIAAIALSPLLFLAEGGYVPPTSGGTLAVIGEGGEGEFVIPESKMGGVGGNEEVVWATQDNGDKLDRIINILGSQGRLR